MGRADAREHGDVDARLRREPRRARVHGALILATLAAQKRAELAGTRDASRAGMSLSESTPTKVLERGERERDWTQASLVALADDLERRSHPELIASLERLETLAANANE